jgi:hypothetical protein
MPARARLPVCSDEAPRIEVLQDTKTPRTWPLPLAALREHYHCVQTEFGANPIMLLAMTVFGIHSLEDI